MSTSPTKIELDQIESPDLVPIGNDVVVGPGLGSMSAGGQTLIFSRGGGIGDAVVSKRRSKKETTTSENLWFNVQSAGTGKVKVKSGKVVSCSFQGVLSSDPKPTKVVNMLDANPSAAEYTVTQSSKIYLKLTYSDITFTRAQTLSGGTTYTVTGGKGGRGGKGGQGGSGGHGGGGGGGGQGGGGGGGGGGDGAGYAGSDGTDGGDGSTYGFGAPGTGTGAGGAGGPGGTSPNDAYPGGAGGAGAPGGAGGVGADGEAGDYGLDGDYGEDGTSATFSVYTTFNIKMRFRYCTSAAVEIHTDAAPPTDTDLIGFVPIAAVVVSGTAITIEQYWKGTYTAHPFLFTYS
jgi:hypothetical protein